MYIFFFSSRRRHTRSYGDWSSDVCSSDLRLEGALGPVPGLDVADVVVRPGAEPQLVAQPEDRVVVIADVEDAGVLVADLVGGDEDVRVVLLHAADAQQAVQGPRTLEAVQDVAVRQPQRQVAGAAHLEVVDDG